MGRNPKKNVYVTAFVTRSALALVGFVYTVFLARYLGTDLRGKYSVVQNYATIIATILTLGVPNAYPFFKRNSEEDNRPEVYRSFLGNSSAMFFICTVGTLIFVLLVPLPEQYKWIFYILPFTYLFKLCNPLGLMEHSRLCNITELSLGILDLLIVLGLMIFTKANFLICFLFLLIDKFIYGAFSAWNLRPRPKDILPRFDRNIGKYIAYGFVPMLTGLLLVLNNKMDIFMMDFFPNVTDSDIGVYSVGVMLAEKIWIIPDALTMIMQSRLASGKDKNEAATVSRICFSLTLVCVIGVAILGKPLINIAYGEAYSQAYIATLIVLLGVVFMVFFKIAYSYNVVVGKNIRNIVYLGITVISNIILNLIMIPRMGMYGAAVATLVSFVVCGSIFLITFSVDTKIPVWNLIFIKKEDFTFLINMIKKKSGRGKDKNEKSDS